MRLPHRAQEGYLGEYDVHDLEVPFALLVEDEEGRLVPDALHRLDRLDVEDERVRNPHDAANGSQCFG